MTIVHKTEIGDLTGDYALDVYVKGGSANPFVLKATVTTYTDTTHFKTTDLTGYGDDYFGGPNNNWYVYAVRDVGGAGALPQGESELISDYVSSDGTFTHVAFTTPLAAGDEVLIVHEWAKSTAGGDATAANQILILTDIGDASASTLLSLYGILGNPSASLATTILDGIDARANNANLNALLGVADAAGRSINGNIGDFQAQTNLQTLLAALGIPDTAAKPLYTCLVTDRLDHATYGLSALDTELALIPQSGGAVSWNATALAAIQGEAEDALEGEDLDHLLKLDSAAQKYPENCATDSVVAKMIAKGDPAVPSTYDCTTDSQQALSDKLGGFSGDGGAAQDDSTKASLDLAHTDLDTIISNQTVGIKKGVERTIVFKMVDATDFATPEPSITVTEERSLDGGAFAACTNAASEIGGAGNGCGWYKITLTATEMNASEIIFKGTGAGCAQCDRLIVTEA